MKNDWNKADNLPPQDRTYVRVADWNIGEELMISAKSPFISQDRSFTLSANVVDGAYILLDTNPPKGYTEVRLRSGQRWWIKTGDLEILDEVDKAKEIARSAWEEVDALDALVEDVILALETPKVRHVLSNMVRQYVIRHMDSEKSKQAWEFPTPNDDQTRASTLQKKLNDFWYF